MNAMSHAEVDQVVTPPAPTPMPLPAPRLPDGRWKALEVVFWLLPVASWFLFPDYLVLASQIMIVGLFALSLDLILGYAGIVSLGHAAFFGLGAYTAGLLAVHGWGEPVTGLLAGAVVAGLFGWIVSFLVVRGQDLTRLMVTLGIGLMLFEAANKASWLTGGVDGLSGMMVSNLLGVFEFDLQGRTAFVYSYVVLFAVFVLLRRLVHSPFGLGLTGIREGGRRMPAIGANVNSRLRAVFTVGAVVAGIAGALIGATVFMIAQDRIAGINPTYWQFWIGLLLVCIVLFAKGGIVGGAAKVMERLRARKEGK